MNERVSPWPVPAALPVKTGGVTIASARYAGSARALTGLFALTLFLSAALVFLVEPMFAKMVLPLLGGSPAVWNTCVVFFQAAMLVGYGYAHLVSRMKMRQQLILHAALLLLVAFTLPVAIPAGWVPPVDRTPVPWLLALLFVGVGAPFVMVSASAPLLQKWFANSDHPLAGDPYFLYSASNVGSILALLSYPFLIEPTWSLSAQSSIWTLGYFLFGALAIGCACAAYSSKQVRSARTIRTAGVGATQQRTSVVTWRRRARWLMFAFVPSSLMLGVTTYLSTDIAAVPLLWTVPLTLYLLSFAIGFAPTALAPDRLAARALPLVVLPLIVAMIAGISGPAWLVMPLHLLVFFACALILHSEFARDRPATDDLTEFYLWIAVGGVLGGLFNTFLAPMLFTGIVEYPSALVLACMLRPSVRARETRRLTTADVALPVLLGAATAGMVFGFRAVPVNFSLLAPVTALVITGYFLLSSRSIRFGLAVAMMLIAGEISRPGEGNLLFAQRTFFGVHRVRVDPGERFHLLYHGSTLHGQQSLDVEHSREPLSYYHANSPIGQVFAAISGKLDAARIAVVGLGAGSMAAYARPGQQWTFYEIDPVVQRIASDPNLFGYLSQCGDSCRVVLGDARLSLARAADRYDVIVLDAFSSDAIPVHLLTSEALGLFADRLADDGVIAFHTSNRHLSLQPLVAALAYEKGWVALTQFDSKAKSDLGLLASEWTILARSSRNFGVLQHDSRWHVPVANGTKAWTDDSSNILTVLGK